MFFKGYSVIHIKSKSTVQSRKLVLIKSNWVFCLFFLLLQLLISSFSSFSSFRWPLFHFLHVAFACEWGKVNNWTNEWVNERVWVNEWVNRNSWRGMWTWTWTRTHLTLTLEFICVIELPQRDCPFSLLPLPLPSSCSMSSCHIVPAAGASSAMFCASFRWRFLQPVWLKCLLALQLPSKDEGRQGGWCNERGRVEGLWTCRLWATSKHLKCCFYGCHCTLQQCCNLHPLPLPLPLPPSLTR